MSYAAALRAAPYTGYYYGADDLPASGTQGQGQDQGYTAGGGDMTGASAMMAAIAPIIEGVTTAVATGVAQQAQPDIMAKNNANKFVKNKAALLRLLKKVDTLRKDIGKKKAKLGELRTESNRKIKQSADWLRDGGNRLPWTTQRTVPQPGRRNCPPLYYGQPSNPNLGGHAVGKPGTWCPTHVSAYRDPVKARFHKDRIQAARIDPRGLVPSVAAAYSAAATTLANKETALDRVLFSRPAGAGNNVTKVRSNLQKNWGLLMGIRAYEPLLRLAPSDSAAAAMLMWAPSERELLGGNTLRLIFPDDPDAADGRIPFLDAAKILTIYLDLYNDLRTQVFDPRRGRMVSIMAEKRPPLWSLGLTEAEQRIVGVSPPLWLVELLARQGLAVTPEQVAQAAQLQAARTSFEMSGYGAATGWGRNPNLPREGGVKESGYKGPKGGQRGAGGAGLGVSSTPPAPADVDTIPGGGFLHNLRQALLGISSRQLGDWSVLGGPGVNVPDLPPFGQGGTSDPNTPPPKSRAPLLIGLGLAGLGAALLWPA